MHTLVPYVLAVAAALVAIPVIALLLEVIAATTFLRRGCSVGPSAGCRGRVVVIVPAHNEGVGMLPTLADITAQLHGTDRLLVVADNCTDDTASVAASAGAEVLERNDREKIGKGYALDWGLRSLRENPPDIVVMIDADCRLSDGALDQLTTTCGSTQRPVQALYLISAAGESGIAQQVAEFALRVKNWVRPLGLRAVNLPCQLAGTGMAFPWGVIRLVDLASGEIVEDLKLGLDLAAAGAAAVFCPSARITSSFPSSIGGTLSQRARWEGGHIGMILAAPALLWTALRRRNLALLALTVDMAVPPLTALAILIMAMFFVATMAVMVGLPNTSLMISGTTILFFAAAIFLSWWNVGRDILPLSAGFLVPLYVIWKIPLYLRILSGRTVAQWTRTDRSKPN
jgi:cellulose synthase/poly-beta-1,6-N-acetylglucosamine synthase-like glycosyltransferase